MPGQKVTREAEWRHITAPSEDSNRMWLIRQRAGLGPCPIRVQVTGRAAKTFEHPLPPTEALKLAVLMTVKDELARRIRADRMPEVDHPVNVTEEDLRQEYEMAQVPSRQ